MKVEMEIVKGEGYKTKALKPKTMMVDERWADRMERVSKGKIRRTKTEPNELAEAPRSRRHRRGNKVEE